MNHDALVRPRIFEPDGRLFSAFTLRSFAGPGRLDAERAARDLASREGFAGLVTAEQVHGGDVALVDADGRVAGCDGLVTATPGLMLGCVAADCAIVLLADTEAGVIGACHAGWRGAVANIAGVTVSTMVGEGASPQQMRAYISPSICLEQFEVGEEVAGRFAPEFVERRPEWDRPHVDLKAVLHSQLVASGLAPDAIELSGGCTYSEPERFYSYRREDGTSGRMLGLIGLLP